MGHEFGAGVRLARLILQETGEQDVLRVFLTSLELVQTRILAGCGFTMGPSGELLPAPEQRVFERPEFMDGMSIGVVSRVSRAMKHDGAPLPWRAALHPLTISAVSPLELLWMCMIAHIGYDLPAAIADARGPLEREHENDYRHTSELLSFMVDDIQVRVREVWPPARTLDDLAGRADEALTVKLVSWARELAWQDGVRIRATAPEHREDALKDLGLRCLAIQAQLVGTSFLPLKLAGLLL